jgi:hypothetical protein
MLFPSEAIVRVGGEADAEEAFGIREVKRRIPARERVRVSVEAGRLTAADMWGVYPEMLRGWLAGGVAASASVW